MNRDFTIAEQIDGIEREIRYRERVYPRLVDEGRMKQDRADYQIDLMRAVRVTVERVGREQQELPL